MKYCVEVCRIGYGNSVINVEADSKEQAIEMALDHAGDVYYSEHTADYVVEDIWENKIE